MLNYPGTPTWKDNVRIAEDGEPASFGYLGLAPEDLGDRTAWLRAQIRPLPAFADLRAIDTTNLPALEVRVVQTKGVYFLDLTSTAAEVLPNIVAPTTGPGRWRMCGREPATLSKALLRPLGTGIFVLGQSIDTVNANTTWAPNGVSSWLLSSGALQFGTVPSTASGNVNGVAMDLTSHFAPFGGMSLSKIDLYFGGISHGALPASKPQFGVLRCDLTTGIPLPLLGGGGSTGWVGDTSATVAAYNAIHTLSYVPNQNQVIDPTKYAYLLILQDEVGTNAVAATTQYRGLELTFS